MRRLAHRPPPCTKPCVTMPCTRGSGSIPFMRTDLEQQTLGVECRKDKGVLDEIPGAYKDIDQVMENQQDLVETVHILKQVLCVKG